MSHQPIYRKTSSGNPPSMYPQAGTSQYEANPPYLVNHYQYPPHYPQNSPYSPQMSPPTSSYNSFAVQPNVNNQHNSSHVTVTHNTAHEPYNTTLPVLSPATITVDYEREKKEENTAIILLIAGFFFPIFWLICFIITRKNISEKSKRYGFIAIGLFITSVFIIIITFVAAVVASAVSRAV